ncbi:MAG TPA: 4-deoxy-4-formamido-L-arabinose-phosphoundecaprenol deformylase [Desulfobulbaceae bacterium]|nr:4-deoxy-4-formamido-L-arabinose-phosphoundecaprenol deformylase [Desulfobulbaceae bacterium]
MNRVGLRVDVDTLRGTRVGVPNLLALLARQHIHATFFFSVGPDNMGRHLWRLLRPAFLLKMLRTRAASLYGWDILVRGTLWPGPEIGRRCAGIIRQTAEDGHEVGLHTWDHQRWQSRLTRLSGPELESEIRQGYEALSAILGQAPDAFAAPAWQVTPEALTILEQFPFRFQSDCRGQAPFRPVIDGRRYTHAQVPTTLPTYDELVGVSCTAETYNEYLLGLIQPDRCNILTIHAEVEGGACFNQFSDFLQKAAQRGIVFTPLGKMLPPDNAIPEAGMTRKTFAGRDGWLSYQEVEGCGRNE